MLTRLRLKNWRSFADTTIDLTPITVLIGANSSGKTNVVDALKFLRDSHRVGLLQVVNQLEYTRILRNAISNDDPEVQIDIWYDALAVREAKDEVRNSLLLRFKDHRTVPFDFENTICEGETPIEENKGELPLRNVVGEPAWYSSNLDEIDEARQDRVIKQVHTLLQHRWQILSDQFMPDLRLSNGETGNPYLLAPTARNLVTVLNYMLQVSPNLFADLEERVLRLLPHLSALEVRPDREEGLELVLREHATRKAWTISTGTARAIALLTAVYALRLPPDNPNTRPTDPGLVVIEEPDVSLSHWQYELLVSMLRTFAEQWNIQFILTTHNPRFLDYFALEEVRLVKRDAEGVSTIQPLSEDIREIWLDEYGLGEVWTTNTFQDMPE